MAESTITLGGRAYAVKTLPITKLLELAAILEDGSLESATLSGLIERSTRLLSLAIRHADPSMTDENVRAIAAPVEELTAATRIVMELAGLDQGEGAPAAS